MVIVSLHPCIDVVTVIDYKKPSSARPGA